MLGCMAVIDPMLKAVRNQLPYMCVVLHTIPIVLACILLNKYFFKSAEGIDGAING